VSVGGKGEEAMVSVQGNIIAFRSKADIFFRNPRANPHVPGENGVLYLLRRDICTCLGRDPSSNFQKRSYSVLFPGGMAILAGVDLLAKFYKGDDEIGGVTQRFKDFVSKYFQLDSSGDEEIIYQLRNSLLHSFGLYSRKGTKTYRFNLVAIRGPLVQKTPIGTYQVDLITLNRQFEEAIQRYFADLNVESELRDKFLAMFPNYGSIYISD
jgi:hypothetical protein